VAHLTFNDPNSIAARQALLDRRCQKVPKRHRTAKRKSRIAAQKHAASRRKAELNARAVRLRRATARAYWSGERADLGCGT
jgi:hypothetical protein